MKQTRTERQQCKKSFLGPNEPNHRCECAQTCLVEKNKAKNKNVEKHICRVYVGVYTVRVKARQIYLYSTFQQ